MKINKLKTFFITAFIALLIPFSLGSKNQNIPSFSTPAITYPPHYINDSAIAYYNSTEINGNIITAFKTTAYNIVFCDEELTYIASFNNLGYKESESVILQCPSLKGIYHDNELILLTQNEIVTIDYTTDIISKSPCNNHYDIRVIDNNIYIFSLGKANIETKDYIYISYPYQFIQKVNDTYIFQGNNEVIFSNFDKELSFEVDTFVDAKYIDGGIVFVASIQNSTIVSKIDNFSISFAIALDYTCKYFNIENLDNGYNIYIADVLTYKYFICKHGDLIEKTLLAEEALIDLNDNIYQKNNIINLTINSKPYEFSLDLYQSLIFIDENFIAFSSYYKQNLEGIYFAKLK